jgi:hypothetical protein
MVQFEQQANVMIVTIGSLTSTSGLGFRASTTTCNACATQAGYCNEVRMGFPVGYLCLLSLSGISDKRYKLFWGLAVDFA